MGLSKNGLINNKNGLMFEFHNRGITMGFLNFQRPLVGFHYERNKTYSYISILNQLLVGFFFDIWCLLFFKSKNMPPIKQDFTNNTTK